MTEKPVPRILFVVLDGLADRPWPELRNRTPLEAAGTPNLDRLAEKGATGLMHPLGRGRAPGSELAHMVLFGYPEELYPGRSVFEAAADGIELDYDEVVFRGLFSAVRKEADGTLTLLEHFTKTDDETCAKLAAAIGDFEHGGLSVRFDFTRKKQGMVRVREAPGLPLGSGPSEDVTDCDPFVKGGQVAAVRPLVDARDPVAAERTADAVTRFLAHVHKTLADHPLNEGKPLEEQANFVLVKWTGRRRALPPFRRRTGMRGMMIASWSLFEGIAKVLGMEYLDAPHMEDDPAKELRWRLGLAVKALADGVEFVHVHTKAPDEAGHEKDPARKRDVVAALDKGIAPLVDGAYLPENTIVVVTGDHGTPAGTKLIHSGDAVPLLVYGPGIHQDDVSEFGELACSKGSLGHFEGKDLMPMLLNLRGTTRYLGARLSPDADLWWPDDYERLKLT